MNDLYGTGVRYNSSWMYSMLICIKGQDRVILATVRSKLVSLTRQVESLEVNDGREENRVQQHHNYNDRLSI
jgi:hypothetical protein